MSETDSIKATVRDQFGRNAEKYVTSEIHANRDDLALLTEWLKPERSWAVLDIATGGGHVAKALAPRVSQVFAADLTREMLAAARKHVSNTANNVWFIAADAEDLPFLDGTFDAVTCRIAAHHFPHPDKFIKEAARVLKPGGKLLFIDNVAPDDPALDEFVNRMEKLRDDSHVRCCQVGEWREWAEQAGLYELQSRVRKKMLDFPKWVRRMATSEEQVQGVRRHILQADHERKRYFCVNVEEGDIVSIAIEEWMVMYKKM